MTVRLPCCRASWRSYCWWNVEAAARAHAGDAAVVPAGTPIQLSKPGTDPASAYVAVPAGFSAAAADGTRIDTPPWAR